MKPVLAYWDIRGRATYIRMLLHYAGVDFEDKRYTFEATDTQKSYNDFAPWFQRDRPTFEGILDFPNLPYYIDDDVKISQSHAILAYLGRKHDLDGKNETELTRMGMIYDQMLDLGFRIGEIAYPPAVQNRQEIHDMERKSYAASLGPKLASISKFLGTHDFMAGSRLTYVDFYAYDILDDHRILFLPKHINEFPNLVAYLQRMEALKGVKEFLASEAFQPMLIMGPLALFGHTKIYTPTE